jgi:hypothetical protein
MDPPERVRVKLSSEAAGSITLTPVVIQEIALRDLLEHVLAATGGKQLERIGETLKRGTLVSGASRLRWEGFDAEIETLSALLEQFPNPEPARPFRTEGCRGFLLLGAGVRIEIAREAAKKRRFLRRRSFWDAAIELGRCAVYETYSYREHADLYTVVLTVAQARYLREEARLLSYPSLARQLASSSFDRLQMPVSRENASRASTST